ncbi:MAG: PAS domain S-box protein [Anaerolineae bacterium]|nr:PAS domain S-box protein [Anaerolineae bacterium]
MPGTRILIVEDEGIIAISMKRRLQSLEYEVVDAVSTGEAAIQRASELLPDLVLMDITLKGEIDGIQAARRIRERFNIPVVYMTAYADPATVMQMNLTEPYGYLLKPVNDREVYITIEMALYAHKLKAQLRASEQKYYELFSEMVSGGALHEIVCDSDGNPTDYVTLEVNHAFENLLHVKREDVVGKRASEILPHNELQEWLEIFSKVALTGDETHYEMYSATQRKYFEGTAYCPEHGKFAVTFSDITERKQTEETLRENEERYRTLYNHTPAMLHSIDAQGRVIGVSDYWLKVLGYTREEVLGRKSTEFLTEASQYYAETVILPVFFQTGWCQNVPYQFVKKNGEIIEVLLSAISEKGEEGQILRSLAVLIDITEHKRKEALLQQTHDVVENLQIGLHVYHLEDIDDDRTFRVVYANPAAGTFTGTRFADIAGKTLDEISPGLREQNIPQRYAEVVRTQMACKLEDIYYRDSYVTYNVFSIKAFPLPHNHVGVSFENITQRKQAEEALRDSEQRVRLKLNALLSPEGDIADLSLTDILNVQAIQSLMDDFFTLTHIGVALLDLDGNILVATGWQDICVNFHRMHPETQKYCLESDNILSEGVAPGTFKIYHCKNNMWDMVTPIMIGERHIGNLFLGQFFFDDEVPNIDVFRAQARRYGFNEAQYLAALERVPRWSHELVTTVMNFYTKLAQQISDLSYSNIKLARLLTERDALLESLRATEQTIRQQNTHMQLAQKLAKMGHWNFDIATGTSVWSKMMFTVLGRDPVKGVPQYDAYRDFIHPDDWERFDQAIQGAISGTPCQVELRIIFPDNSIHFVVVQGHPQFNESDQVISLFGIIQDITEHKRMENDLRESKNLLQKILETIPVGVWIMDREGKIVHGNPAGQHIWAGARYVGPERFGEYKAWWLDTGQRIAPDEWAGARAIAKGEASLEEEIEIECFDGTHKIVLNSGVPIFGPDKKIEGAIAINQDITKRKQAAQELEHLYTQAQRDANIRAELLREVNHRVSNTLTSILGLLDTEQRFLPDVSRVIAEPLLERVRERVRGLLEAHSFLSQSGWTPVRLTELAGRVIGLALQALPSGYHKYVTIVPSATEISPRQADRLALIINELVTNTIKYATGERIEVTITVNVTQEDNMISLEYRDDGPGYPPDVLHHERQGVGLYLLERLVTYDIHGTLSLHNDNGAVTTLHFGVESKDRIDDNPKKPGLSEETNLLK